MKFIKTEDDYGIEYNTDTKLFVVTNKSGDIVKETASEDALDKFLSGEEQEERDKKEKKKSFERVKVFMKGYHGWVFGVVTSVVEKNYARQKELEVWVTMTNDERGKEYAKYLFLDNERNKEEREKIDALNKQIAGLHANIGIIEKEMTTVESVLTL